MDKHSLWQRYVPLVRHEALLLQVRLPASVDLDDLLQVGGIGLLNAVVRYFGLQGTAFSTSAVQRIPGDMLDDLRLILTCLQYRTKSNPVSMKLTAYPVRLSSTALMFFPKMVQ